MRVFTAIFLMSGLGVGEWQNDCCKHQTSLTFILGWHKECTEQNRQNL